ncbi:MAG: hypothetical protein KIT14_03340 [bacterium]|nr:hypothetical protein [bacterium]
MRPTALIAAALVGLVTTAHADVLCRKKSGVALIRPDACRKKETAVDPAALGLVGPTGAAGAAGATGPEGPAGPPGPNAVRAWAHVDPSDPSLVAASGITGVARASTGVFCLTPQAGVDADTSLLGVSVDYYHSSGAQNFAQISYPQLSCAEGTFEVRTFDGTGSLANTVSFVLVAY